MFGLIRKWLGLTPTGAPSPQDTAAAQALADAGLLVPKEAPPKPGKPKRRAEYDRDPPDKRPATRETPPRAPVIPPGDSTAG